MPARMRGPGWLRLAQRGDRRQIAQPHVAACDWHRALQIYVAVAALANLAWETLQLPLYTIWTTGTLAQQAFAVIHCTGGDVLIAMATLVVALISVGNKHWPAASHGRVLLVTILLGVGYAIFSEWLNVVVRASWAYSPLMPIMPILNTGLSPLLQWIAIPTLSLSVARTLALAHSNRPLGL